MKAFVTGSTGLLGNNLVRLLIEQKHQVKALVRSKDKAKKIFGDLPIEYIVGDMEKVEAFAAKMRDCDVLFHTAAYFREYYQKNENHWKKLEDINIKGTIRILEEAEKCGVRKAIYVSSSGTIGMQPDGSAGDENTPPSSFATDNLYFKSKVLADQAVDEFIEKHELSVVRILPGWMFGIGDAAPTSSGQIVLDFLNGKLPGTFNGGTSTVDAKDVAQAMIDAVEKGKTGEKYIVGGEFYSMEEIVGNLAEVSGLPKLKLKIPNFAILTLANFSELFSRLTGKPAVISKNGIKTLQAKLTVDSSKAKRELGAKFRPISDTLRDEVNWYRQNGYVS
ncbi:MAG: SDR family oxidoreductase [Acidobacteriota bacterium]|nr:SDR family oxidoreductase [Acidobacteriota bacterium]